MRRSSTRCARTRKPTALRRPVRTGAGSDANYLPNSNPIAGRFGSWGAALVAAGLAPRRIRADCSDEQILDGLRRFAEDHGRPPRAADRVGQLAQYPGLTLVISRFGSWSAALRKAGLEPGNPAPATAQQIIRALRAYDQEHGVTPTVGDWRRDDCTPGDRAIRAKFGSWTAAVQAAGLEPHRIRVEWSDEQILDGHRRLASDHGRPPRKEDRVGSLSRYPSPTLVRSRFGSWSAALRKAGLAPGGVELLTDERVVRALVTYHREHGRSPTSTAWRKARLRPTAAAIARHCGSWADALALAGLKPAARVAHGPGPQADRVAL